MKLGLVKHKFYFGTDGEHLEVWVEELPHEVGYVMSVWVGQNSAEIEDLSVWMNNSILKDIDPHNRNQVLRIAKQLVISAISDIPAE